LAQSGLKQHHVAFLPPQFEGCQEEQVGQEQGFEIVVLLVEERMVFVVGLGRSIEQAKLEQVEDGKGVPNLWLSMVPE